MQVNKTQHMDTYGQIWTQDVVVLTLALHGCIIDLPPRYTIRSKTQSCSVSVSPMHCEFMPWLWQIIKEANQILFYQEWITVLPLTATTDITCKGDEWKNKYRPLALLVLMSGKWGNYNHHRGNEMRSDSPQAQQIFKEMRQEIYGNEPTQLDRIEAKLDELLAKKKRKPKAQASKAEYPDWFEDLWKAYPKRAGSNPKQKAFQAANARFNEVPSDIHGEFQALIIRGVKRYAAFCDATDKVGTEYVMMASTFFGPDKHFIQDWIVPKAAIQQNLMPKNDEDLAAFAVAQGLHAPGCAPQNLRNMSDYRKWIQERLS